MCILKRVGVLTFVTHMDYKLGDINTVRKAVAWPSRGPTLGVEALQTETRT